MASFEVEGLSEFLKQVVLMLEKFSFVGLNTYFIKLSYVVSLVFTFD